MALLGCDVSSCHSLEETSCVPCHCLVIADFPTAPRGPLRSDVSPANPSSPTGPHSLCLSGTLSLAFLTYNMGPRCHLAASVCARVPVCGGRWPNTASPSPHTLGQGYQRLTVSCTFSSPQRARGERANLFFLRTVQKDDTGCGSLSTNRPTRLLFLPDEITKKSICSPV